MLNGTYKWYITIEEDSIPLSSYTTASFTLPLVDLSYLVPDVISRGGFSIGCNWTSSISPECIYEVFSLTFVPITH